MGDSTMSFRSLRTILALSFALVGLATAAPVLAGGAEQIAFPDAGTLGLVAGALAAGLLLGRLRPQH
jgi:hypothetical protein